MIKRALVYFGAGAAGGLTNSLAVYLFGMLGLTAALGVSIAPALTPAWLYPRIVWGGIWGVLLFTSFYKGKLLARAFVISLGPSLVQLFVVFPYKANKGVAGLELGTATPLFVLLFNFVWGLTAVLLARKTK